MAFGLSQQYSENSVHLSPPSTSATTGDCSRHVTASSPSVPTTLPNTTIYLTARVLSPIQDRPDNLASMKKNGFFKDIIILQNNDIIICHIIQCYSSSYNNKTMNVHYGDMLQ